MKNKQNKAHLFQKFSISIFPGDLNEGGKKELCWIISRFQSLKYLPFRKKINGHLGWETPNQALRKHIFSAEMIWKVAIPYFQTTVENSKSESIFIDAVGKTNACMKKSFQMEIMSAI